MSGQEYGLDIFNDLEVKSGGFALRKKLSMRAGETDRAIRVESRLSANWPRASAADCGISEMWIGM
jgi:beta-glucanase (GH16 family)